MENAPNNDTLKSPMIQKDISNAAATETVNAIIDEIKGELFAVLIDEARDISIKEQMAVVLRYVNKKGCVIERFLGIQHVLDTSAVSLKEALENLFAKHGLSIMRLRGQGYDGASNMQGEFNGLKTVIMKDNKSAFYVHCFAHQLQLALVHVMKDLPLISSFFLSVTSIVNVVGVSSKRRDKLRSIQADKVFHSIESGETETGTGLNQESGLKRACDTRWGTHYNTLVNVMVLFSPLIDLFEVLLEDRSSSSDLKGEVFSLLDLMQTFGFIFNLHLMKNMLGITDDLSKALQKKNQNIVNAMDQVRSAKERLQDMREKGWCSFLDDVSKFCEKHSVVVPQMEDKYVAPGRSRRKVEEVTNLFHYRVELFYTCIDKQLQELNNRFNEVNTELLLCMASLDPSTTFAAFDKDKLVRLAHFYPDDFSEHKLMILQDQLENYIMDVRHNCAFKKLKGIGALAEKMVETKKNLTYPLVFLLVKLSLILPVSTATVERAFSAMNIVKNRLRNRMHDDWMNDCLITYIEKDMLKCIDKEAIIQRFQNMKSRRGKL